jgi:hypothetical protein
MSLWLFASKNVENIKVASERLLWGFWDRESGEKQRKNWRDFIRLYNKIKPFDIVVFQTTNGNIHGIGVVKGTYYDDQTPVWPAEKKGVLFPWRVSFCVFIFSENPFTSLFIKIANFIDGYGIGELDRHEFQGILREIQKRLDTIKFKFNL